MTRLSLFNSPLLLGFDQFERTLNRIAKMPAEGYPPYNIEQIGEDRLKITLAVAGFTEDDLSIQIDGNQLVVQGKQSEDGDDGREYLHRGIATRQFQRCFVLADGIEVTGAAMDNGLLIVDLVRPLPETRVRSIEIQRRDGKSAGRKTIETNTKARRG